jgi:hypothetical protein
VAQLEKQNHDLATRLEAVSKAANLDLQQKCAKAAEDAFKGSGLSGHGSGFTNHYNTRLNKCFVYMTSTGSPKGLVISAFVYDAFEGKTYGEYHQFSDGRCYCNIIVGNEDSTCRSLKQFDGAMKSYMEQ